MNRPAWIAVIVMAALVLGSAFLVFVVINP
jgi:hypothetical protein